MRLFTFKQSNSNIGISACNCFEKKIFILPVRISPDKATGETIYSISIITCKPNAAMAVIHNNPKAEKPRMPVILSKELQNDWLMPLSTPLDEKKLMELVVSYPKEVLKYHPVHKILGKEALGNVPEVESIKKCPELTDLSIKINS